jgi:hypothetical protein
MASEGITKWLRARRRNAFVISVLYSAVAMTGGALLMLPTFILIFLAVKIAVLLVVPMAPVSTIIGLLVALVVSGLVYADSIAASRDDMSILGIWLVRECLHAGPRLNLDGIRGVTRAARLSRVQIELCADVLSYLAARESAVSQDELMRAFPDLDWTRLISDLGLFEGVLFLNRNVPRLSLTTTLRLVLSRFVVKAQRVRVEIPKREAEPEPVPVDEPESLSPNEILGVRDGATAAEIKAAYRNRVKECHPDRFVGMDERSRELAEEWTKALNAAYETLVAQNGSRNRTER